MGEINREYLKKLSLDELKELYKKYDNLYHNSSRYDINQSLYFYDIVIAIELEITSRNLALNNNNENNSCIKTRIKK